MPHLAMKDTPNKQNNIKTSSSLSIREGEQPKPPCVDLPTDIWALIADRLGSTEEVARVCGACPAFNAVQPRGLNLTKYEENSKLGELIWGLRHGRNAQAVHLNIWSLKHKQV